MTIEIRVRVNDDNMFAAVGRDDTDVVFFYGHSEAGAAVQRSLDDALERSGDGQLIVLGNCISKGALNRVEQHFPGTDLMVTRRIATHEEVLAGFEGLVAGISEQATWGAIDRKIETVTREKAESKTKISNWITPGNVALHGRLVDRDQDGLADLRDARFDARLVSVPVNEDAAFEPIEPPAPPERLRATFGAAIADWLNADSSAYNEATRRMSLDTRVSCAGFDSGSPSAPPVRFTPTVHPDGTPGYFMWLNPFYAHMPELALRQVAILEYHIFLSEAEREYAHYEDPVKARVSGLLAASFSANVDLDDRTADEHTWKELLTAYGLPESLDLEYVQSRASQNRASSRFVHAGSAESVEAIEDAARVAGWFRLSSWVKLIEDGKSGTWQPRPVSPTGSSQP